MPNSCFPPSPQQREGITGGDQAAGVFLEQVSQAVGVAHSHLAIKSCLDGLFPGAPSSGPDPQAMLDQMFADGNIVQGYDANSSIAAWPRVVVNPKGSIIPGDPPPFINQIDINSNPAPAWNTRFPDTFNVSKGLPWNETDERLYRAMTLIHELAHIYAFMNDLHTGFEKNDKDDPAQQALNQAKVFALCFL
jgi:hypothetical protein